MKTICLIIAFVFIVMPFGINVSANENLREQLKKYDQSPKELRKSMLDSSLRNRIQDFILDNANVPLKDFRKVRLLVYAINVFIEDLKNKYRADAGDLPSAIIDTKDSHIYQIASDLRNNYYFREFLLCKGDKAKAVESFQRVQRLIERFPKDKGVDSEEHVILEREILQECKFNTSAIQASLIFYRSKNLREEYNNLMLRILREDQIEFDYSYFPIDKPNCIFVGEYLLFFANVNPPSKKMILSKEQVKFIAEDMLTKHQELLNFKNECYFPSGNIDEYMVRDGVNALISVSTWLREYKLNELNDKLLERYFSDELVLNTMRYDPQFKDFMNYLQKWREEKEKAEREKKKSMGEPKTKK